MDLRLSGLSTGLDTSSIIQQLMNVERRPIRMWQNTQAKYQAELDLFRQLNTKLSALQNAADAVTGSGLSASSFSAKKAVSGNTALFSATAGNKAATGNFNIEVVKLALAQKNGLGNFTATAGTVDISDGTNNWSINISGGTIEQTANEINAANAGMGATIIDDGLGNANSKRLLLTAKQTGVTYTVGGTAATGIGVTTLQQAAQQAHVKIDGTDVYSNTNTFTNPMTDVTINAVAVGTSTLTISADNSAAVAKVKDLVDKYNEIIKFIDTHTKYDEKAKKGGALLGDSFVRGLRSQLNRLATDIVDPTDASAKGYAQYATNVGIEVTREGTLKLDEAELSAALSADPARVYKLFGNEDGVAGTGGAAKSANIGNRATNTVGDGIAVRLSGYVQSLVNQGGQYLAASQEGGLLGRINGMERTVDNYNDRISAYERRLELRERSLRAQFVAMEKSVTMLRSQGSYMASQMAGMTAR